MENPVHTLRRQRAIVDHGFKVIGLARPQPSPRAELLGSVSDLAMVISQSGPLGARP